MKRLIAAIVLLLPLGAISAEAQKIDCENASSTVEMNFCAEKDFKAADKDLNVAYANAVAFIKERKLEKPYDAKSFEEALRAAQRTWLAYRDSDCKDLIAQEWSGGSGTAAASLECMTAKTIERTKELKDRYEEH
ncbi:MAG: lysozyme inhibitor LprI family protein [Hyphomicrobium sp.]|uniref:lysozyme inhibitor LprI family protein n=1 Tax=Hyphomicrobium sp. TaxID=82 RepID=UPI003561A092